jgi:hypothetical protein
MDVLVAENRIHRTFTIAMGESMVDSADRVDDSDGRPVDKGA